MKLAFIHKIDHHVDIGLLELFLLTYSNVGKDYHCIHISEDLTGDSPKLLKSMVECFNQLWGEKRIFVANQDTPEFWKKTAKIGNPELICLRELLEFKSDWHYTILKVAES